MIKYLFLILFLRLNFVYSSTQCSCALGYRNGAQSTDANLCMGPSERGKRPCYPTPCNADWTPCTNAEEDTLWTKDSSNTGKRPDCPFVKINNQGQNYLWATLDNCKKKCIDEPTGKCNIVSRFGDTIKSSNEPYHCRFYACPDPNNFQWVTQSQWGNYAAQCNSYKLLIRHYILNENIINKTRWTNKTRYNNVTIYKNKTNWIDKIRWTDKTRWTNKTLYNNITLLQNETIWINKILWVNRTIYNNITKLHNITSFINTTIDIINKNSENGDVYIYNKKNNVNENNTNNNCDEKGELTQREIIIISVCSVVLFLELAYEFYTKCYMEFFCKVTEIIGENVVETALELSEFEEVFSPDSDTIETTDKNTQTEKNSYGI